jgi:hypothetical protein
MSYPRTGAITWLGNRDQVPLWPPFRSLQFCHHRLPLLTGHRAGTDDRRGFGGLPVIGIDQGKLPARVYR